MRPKYHTNFCFSIVLLNRASTFQTYLTSRENAYMLQRVSFSIVLLNRASTFQTYLTSRENAYMLQRVRFLLTACMRRCRPAGVPACDCINHFPFSRQQCLLPSLAHPLDPAILTCQFLGVLVSFHSSVVMCSSYHLSPGSRLSCSRSY